MFIVLATDLSKHFLSYIAIWWCSLEKAESHKADALRLQRTLHFQLWLSQAHRDYVFWIIWLLLL